MLLICYIQILLVYILLVYIDITSEGGSWISMSF